MNTIRTISNISYNTPEFFEERVNTLVNTGVIDWCYWILHKADIDELKNHIHFVLKPSKRVNTADLRSFFNEIDLNNPAGLPLTCTTRWNPCNSLEDWLLYAVHDTHYLESKGQSRNYRYEFSDIKSTDYDALRCDWTSIDRRKFDRLHLLVDFAQQRVPFYVLVQTGVVPIAQRSQFERQYYDIIRSLQSDSGRKLSHEFVDNDGVIHDNDFIPADDIKF